MNQNCIEITDSLCSGEEIALRSLESYSREELEYLLSTINEMLEEYKQHGF